MLLLINPYHDSLSTYSPTRPTSKSFGGCSCLVASLADGDSISSDLTREKPNDADKAMRCSRHRQNYRALLLARLVDRLASWA